jgi:uncharacterized 2Fe-2S/4Fe-4S cluster protein (DUF4445 family)
LAQVTFLPEGTTVAVEAGSTLLHAARQAGLHIDAPCGEQGLCGKCRVRVVDGAMSPLDGEETTLLRADEIAAGVRLSCVAQVQGAVTAEIPEASRNLAHRKATAELRRHIAPAPFTRKVCARVPQPSLEERDFRDDLNRLRAVVPGIGTADLAVMRGLHRALEDGKYAVSAVLADERLIAVEPGDTCRTHYGVALDIGTTTVVGYLINLRTGEEVAVASQANLQAGYGADVISRIEYAQHDAAHLETLRAAVTKSVNTILQSLAKQAHTSTEQIYEMTVVGNTCMAHLFLGIDPSPLGHAPYAPVLADAMHLTAAELGLAMHPRGRVRTLPNIAGFVGADTVGVLAASDLEHLKGLHAAVDIGTNAEVMVAKDGHVVACSTAAGPAFEGAKISQGMRAQPGAIDGVTIGHDLYAHTIDGKKAQGICGSGIIDAIGELRRVGMLESSGRVADPDDLTHLPTALRERLRDGEVVLVWAKDSGTGSDITLTQKDVREVQLVKASIFAGIATLLDKLGYTPDQLDGLHIAGAFGTYITKEHALRIGLIPNIPEEKLIFLGNAAGAGAKMALINRDEYVAICAAARRVSYVELAGDETFRDNFAMAMMLAPGCEDDD